jgi:hypothetical protein
MTPPTGKLSHYRLTGAIAFPDACGYPRLDVRRLLLALPFSGPAWGRGLRPHLFGFAISIRDIAL